MDWNDAQIYKIRLDTKAKRINELESLNAELVEALETVKIVNAGNGPLRYEIVDATCESTLAKARGES